MLAESGAPVAERRRIETRAYCVGRPVHATRLRPSLWVAAVTSIAVPESVPAVTRTSAASGLPSAEERARA